MDECEPEGPESGEVEDLAPRDTQASRPDERDRREEQQSSAGGAYLGEAHG